jgi:hypothetical protein
MGPISNTTYEEALADEGVHASSLSSTKAVSVETAIADHPRFEWHSDLPETPQISTKLCPPPQP